MLVNLVDGGIIDIYTDETYYQGCETCDYGSEYIQDISVKMTNRILDAKTNQMCGYAFSMSDFLKLFLNNLDGISKMTEEQFIEWFCSKVKANDKDAKFTITVTVNEDE